MLQNLWLSRKMSYSCLCSTVWDLAFQFTAERKATRTLRRINVFLFQVCPLSATSYVLHHQLMISTSCTKKKKKKKLVKGERKTFLMAFLFFFFFFFLFLHLNQRIITVCTTSLKKKPCREINTDLKLVLYGNRQIWWRHKPCCCQLHRKNCPALGTCSLRFWDVQ